MIKISNPKQMKRLVELMEKNKSLATNLKRGVSQTVATKTAWEEVTEILNSLGPPLRYEKEWQKVWFDLKFKVKKKLVFNKKQQEATGGGAYKQKVLTDIDVAVARLLALNETIDPVGKQSGCYQAIQTTERIPCTSRSIHSPNESIIRTTSTLNKQASDCTLIKTTNDFDPLEASFCSTAVLSPERVFEDETEESQKESSFGSIKTTSSSEKLFLRTMLGKQLQVQESLYNEVKDSLKKIETYLKESARYERKRFCLEEKRFKLYKLQMERDEKQRIEENKLKIMKWKIKERQLDIEQKKMHIEAAKEYESPN